MLSSLPRANSMKCVTAATDGAIKERSKRQPQSQQPPRGASINAANGAATQSKGSHIFSPSTTDFFFFLEGGGGKRGSWTGNSCSLKHTSPKLAKFLFCLESMDELDCVN